MLRSRLQLGTAVNLYFAITAFALFYHLLIVTQVVDYKNAWGGRLENTQQMYVFEAVSIIVQVVFAVIIYLKAYSAKGTTRYKVTKPLVFIIAIVFLLNTLGNIFAIEWFERLVFTPLTLIASILALRVALE